MSDEMMRKRMAVIDGHLTDGEKYDGTYLSGEQCKLLRDRLVRVENYNRTLADDRDDWRNKAIELEAALAAAGGKHP